MSMVVWLASCAAVCAAGFSVWAFVGRRVGHEPRCGRCDYDLTGLPQGVTVCSECGSDVSQAGGRVIGARRRRWWLCVASMLVTLVASGVILLGAAGGGTWRRYQPEWWLLWDYQTRVPDAQTEVTRRLSSWPIELSTAGQQRLVECLLKLQADYNVPWLPLDGQLIEELMTRPWFKAEWKRLYVQNAVRVTLEFRPEVYDDGVLAFRLVESFHARRSIERGYRLTISRTDWGEEGAARGVTPRREAEPPLVIEVEFPDSQAGPNRTFRMTQRGSGLRLTPAEMELLKAGVRPTIRGTVGYASQILPRAAETRPGEPQAPATAFDSLVEELSLSPRLVAAGKFQMVLTPDADAEAWLKSHARLVIEPSSGRGQAGTFGISFGNPADSPAMSPERAPGSLSDVSMVMLRRFGKGKIEIWQKVSQLSSGFGYVDNVGSGQGDTISIWVLPDEGSVRSSFAPKPHPDIRIAWLDIPLWSSTRTSYLPTFVGRHSPMPPIPGDPTTRPGLDEVGTSGR
jgi:hypothetical protein